MITDDVDYRVAHSRTVRRNALRPHLTLFPIYPVWLDKVSLQSLLVYHYGPSGYPDRSCTGSTKYR